MPKKVCVSNVANGPILHYLCDDCKLSFFCNGESYCIKLCVIKYTDCTLYSAQYTDLVP